MPPTAGHQSDALSGVVVPVSAWTGRSIVEVFEAAAAEHAERIAIEEEETRLSYGALRDRVDCIAAALASRLSAPNQHVALFVDPGADAVASILGVLKAGHAYVPLDPADPPARLEFMLRHSQARTILAGAPYADLAQQLAAETCQVLGVDEAVRRSADAPERAATDPAAIALVMYTSGSTGQPKGVLQTHRNLLHYVRQYSAFLNVAPGDRLSMLYSLSFSASSMDIYGAILNGATLCFLNVRQRGVARLASWIDEKGITVLHTVPTLFRHLLEHSEGRTGFPTVRAIDLGGEAVVTHDVELCRARFRPDCMLVNHLAATELSVMAQHVLDAVGDRPGTMPVGKPAPGVMIRILNEAGEAAAPDEPGEIVIHSPFLSPGYWQQPELTAKAFADDPERPGWRTYRSGDMGSMTRDGVLSALGRRDAVIKVRGHSVHLAEVEASIRQVPGVDETAVVAVTDDGGPPRLVAYFVSRTLDPASLRRKLPQLLPRYAWPSDVCLLDALPRTVGGKIDHRTLAKMKRPATISPSIEPPANPAEREVAALFSRLLNLPEVGRADDFFEMGGESLLFAELQMELERRLGRELAPQDLLKDSTVAGIGALLGRVVVATEAGAPTSVLVPIRETGSRPALFLVHGGAGRASVSPRFLEVVGPEQPVYAFQARGLDGFAQPHRDITEMAAAYAASMRRIQPEGPYYLGAVCAGALVAHEMACQLKAAGQSLAPLLLLDPPLPPREQGLPRFLTKIVVLRLATLMSRTARTRSILARGRRWRWRGARGRVPAVWPESYMRVWIQFRIAAFRHRLRTYDGPVHILASRQRIIDLQSGAWKANLTGDVQSFEVGHVHRDVFDPSNEQAAAQLKRCVETAQAWLARAAERPLPSR